MARCRAFCCHSATTAMGRQAWAMTKSKLAQTNSHIVRTADPTIAGRISMWFRCRRNAPCARKTAVFRAQGALRRQRNHIDILPAIVGSAVLTMCEFVWANFDLVIAHACRPIAVVAE